HAAGDDAPPQQAVGADLGPAHHDGALDRRALAHGDAVLEHRAAADVGAAADRAAALDQRRGHDPALVVHAALDAQVRRAHALGDLGPDRALEDVERALQVALGRADVEPVAL